MTTIPAGPKNDLALEKFEAEVREAEARLNVLEADAKARQARADMDEISGLTGIQTGIRHQIAELKHAAAQDYAQTQADVKDSIAKLQAAIKRLDARLAAWDEAADRRLNAQLDKAEAKLEVWKAQADQRKAERGMKRQDELDELANELAKLNETIALARARSAEAKHEEYSAKSQAAVHEAALRFNEAFDIASARYDK